MPNDPMEAAARKIECHAPGDRCHGCAHYQGKADVCEHAPAALRAERERARREGAEAMREACADVAWAYADEQDKTVRATAVYRAIRSLPLPSAEAHTKMGW